MDRMPEGVRVFNAHKMIDRYTVWINGDTYACSHNCMQPNGVSSYVGEFFVPYDWGTELHSWRRLPDDIKTFINNKREEQDGL